MYLNMTVIWENPPRWWKSSLSVIPPSTSQHRPNLLYKPLKIKWKKEKPPLLPGLLLGIDWDREKQSQSGDSFC